MTKPDLDADVLICGAGAAGLTLAIELARRGISFLLIEKLEQPFPGSRGKGIQPRTQEMFEDLGILDRIVAAGGLYPPPREYHPDGGYSESPVMEHEDSTPAEPYHLPLMVPQFSTERVLRERLVELGRRPEVGCELVAFEQGDDGVTARVASKLGEQHVRARYLVGADGGRSFVRQALGIGFPGKTLGMRAIVADVVLSGLDRDAWHRFNGGDMDRHLSLCPLAGTELFQVQAAIPLEGDVDLTKEGIARLVAERTERDFRVHSVTWASAFHMNARLADRYRVARVFLIGDAAHVHPPTGGQGLNTSVQDAYNLGWKLAAVIERRASIALLDSYEEERRPIAADMLGLSTRLLEDVKRGSLRRGREVHQLDIGYRGSSLAFEAPQRAERLVAGDRAPDAPIRGAAGQATRLFQLFKGPHWTLLGYDVARDAVRARPGLHIHGVGPGGDLIDEGSHVRAAYGLSAGDWVLVRPDGYVGALVDSHHIAALEGYLDTAGIALPS